MTRIEKLQCCSCGAETHGRQWHNRDKGYGICDKCAEGEEGCLTPAQMQSFYGIKGIHYCISQEEKNKEVAEEIYCHACGVTDVKLLSDFRTHNETTGRFPSCEKCVQLTDEDYFKLAAKTDRKRKNIGHVEIIVECPGMSSEDLEELINAQLDVEDILKDNPNVQVTVEAET